MKMQEMAEGAGGQVPMDTFKLNPQARMKVQVSNTVLLFG